MSINIKSVIYKTLISTVGNLLVFIQPKKARKLSETGLTLSMSKELSFTEKLMRNAIIAKAEKKKDYNTLEQFHTNYWKNQGDDFFSATKDSFEKEFLPNCSFIFDLLQEQINSENESFETLVEIGTGNGKVLEYLSSKFPAIQRFVGIDLSPVQIDLNTKNYKNNPKLEFVATDGFDWVKANGHSHIIFVTSRGVLEYFPEKKLKEFFNLLRDLGKTIFVAIEPKGIDHDFSSNPNSELYGYERSFSHNYARLFENAGFDLWHISEKPHDETATLNYIGAKN